MLERCVQVGFSLVLLNLIVVVVVDVCIHSKQSPEDVADNTPKVFREVLAYRGSRCEIKN